MSKTWTLYKRELGAYFYSPLAYVVLVLILVLMAGFFAFFLAGYTFEYNQYQQMISIYKQYGVTDIPPPPDFSMSVVGAFYFWVTFILLFLLPMLTMRLLSEEKRAGTMEMVLTYPVSDGAFIVGKYLACVTVLVVALVLTLFFPLYINWISEERVISWTQLGLSYLACFLVGSAFISLGLFVSSLTRSQVIAAVGSFAILFGFFFLWMLSYQIDSLEGASGILQGPDVVAFFKHLSIFGHSENFLSGLLDTRDILYCVNFILAGLFLSWFSLSARKWRA